jgi:hypothetical protein
MGKIATWFLSKIPSEYKAGVAIKKASYTIGKLAAAAFTMGWLGQHVGSHLTPDQIKLIEGATGAIVAGGLEAVHDYAKLKWPDNPLL